MEQPTDKKSHKIETEYTPDKKTVADSGVSDMSRKTPHTPIPKAVAMLFGLIALVIIGVIVVALYLSFDKNSTSQTQTDGTVTERQTLQDDGNKVTTEIESTIASVAERVSPSVVSIVSETSNRRGYYLQQGVGAGTGIIVSKNGYILTNKHVVENASALQVVTSDGTVYEDVQLVGSDPLNDVAFLKVQDVSNLKPATLGDSTTVRIGQQVIAIGNSLGQYQNTVTSGIISGTGRPIVAGGEYGQDQEALTDLLQTDAAINPGNSGGPLLNASGQVIGINTAVAADAQGIGFAIPINAAKGLLKGVLKGQGVSRAYLGVQYQSLNKILAKEYELSVDRGAYIYSSGRQSAVIPGGPADKAGLKKGDVVTAINGVEVGKVAGFSSLIAEYAPGDVVELTIRRGSQDKTVKVTLAQFNSPRFQD